MIELIKDIKQKLNIDGGFYIDAEIEESIKHIDKSKYFEFFQALSGNHEFSKPMDRIANVAKKFQDNKDNLLLAGTKQQAKDMYDKFYAENCSMTSYTQLNRDKVPNDREFFESVKYAELKRKDGTKTYSPQELYVLNELGGGSWLIDIRFLPNTQVAISKIEKIIKTAIITKYSDGVAIGSPKVMKMIKDGGNK